MSSDCPPLSSWHRNLAASPCGLPDPRPRGRITCSCSREPGSLRRPSAVWTSWLPYSSSSLFLSLYLHSEPPSPRNSKSCLSCLSFPPLSLFAVVSAPSFHSSLLLFLLPAPLCKLSLSPADLGFKAWHETRPKILPFIPPAAAPVSVFTSWCLYRLTGAVTPMDRTKLEVSGSPPRGRPGVSAWRIRDLS